MEHLDVLEEMVNAREEELIAENEELKERIDKAIQYIKYNATSNYFDNEKNIFRREKDLLEILKGDNNE